MKFIFTQNILSNFYMKYIRITHQYWKNVTSKFEGWVVISKFAGAVDKSEITCALFNVLCGEGGELAASV